MSQSWILRGHLRSHLGCSGHERVWTRVAAAGRDLQPREEWPGHWHPRTLGARPEIRWTLLFRRYAQRYFRRENLKKDLPSTVRAWRDYGPVYLPMPHPSPRNIGWFKRNPWFENEVVPELRRRLVGLL